ncbi:MAG: hypothetical protein IKM43_02250 [Clostridia bacterium]|nr:hypothetical protein [Clostridia bacterium]
MREEIEEYIKYMDTFKEVKKPYIPRFSSSAYTDNEYLCAIHDIMQDFDQIDDFDISLKYLKGE